jgi:hypothetical protein
MLLVGSHLAALLGVGHVPEGGRLVDQDCDDRREQDQRVHLQKQPHHDGYSRFGHHEGVDHRLVGAGSLLDLGFPVPPPVEEARPHPYGQNEIKQATASGSLDIHAPLYVPRGAREAQ